MRVRSLLPGLLTLGALGLIACSEDVTQPNLPAAPNFAAATELVASSWIRRADMWGGDRYDMTSATVTNAAGQSVIFAIGGRNAPDGGSLSKVMAYNVATNTWSIKASLPHPLYLTNGAGVIDGKIYLSGGYDVNRLRSRVRLTFMYDPAADTWTQKQDMPALGTEGVSGVIGNKLYVFTEQLLNTGPGHLFRYDPASDTWDILPDPPREHRSAVGGVLYGKFYLLGSDIFNAAHQMHLDSFDPATNRWTALASPPEHRVSSAGAVQGGRLYVLGGWRERENGLRDSLPVTLVYHPLTDKWTTAARPPTSRIGATASRAVLNGRVRIELMGGARPGNNLQFVP